MRVRDDPVIFGLCNKDGRFDVLDSCLTDVSGGSMMIDVLGLFLRYQIYDSMPRI